MSAQTPSEYERITNTLVRVCAKGHSVVIYYVRRDQPESPCPACAAKPANA